MSNHLHNNINFLAPTGFRIIIGSRRNVDFYCAEVNLPDITLSAPDMTYMGFRSNAGGDSIEYGSFSFKLMIDEDMTNYLEIYDWIVKNRNSDLETDDDCELQILTSNKNLNLTVRFTHCHPTSLSGITFSTQNSDVEYASATVNMAYTNFEFTRRS